ncbi:hypothetical protein [Bradyrhizobium sp. CER78]|uniref:hypothetical protein n=1 Tax=Bradyrhizobium sp. CER78 TaxID=3039162 RepID=UPI00244AE23A|nr:hypothetical protein [Bradyrhizobium sp. CER78]MDH2382844.1 hypothetical protein [Bradyrhizobium sp. CER78]
MREHSAFARIRSRLQFEVERKVARMLFVATLGKGTNQVGHWEFDSVQPSSVRMEVTQADQFNNDEVSLAEALVRESIQNSSDAPTSPNVAVKVRFAIREVSGAEAKWLSEQLKPLLSHYKECEFDAEAIEAKRFRVLAIEDFNTRGLTGSVVDVDGGNFDRFWRAVGDSGKKGKAGGRWGLGKLVYSSASALKLFYGLTVTADRPEPSLLGQVVLKNHRIGNSFHPAHGFYFSGRSAPLQLQQPIMGEEVAQFCKLGGLARKNQTGLSLIIPYLLDGIDETSIISGVISNYYFPILAGRLIVEVGNVVIDKSSFLSVADKYKPLHPIPFDFVEQISRTIDDPAQTTAQTALGKAELDSASFKPEQIAQMKKDFVSGKLVRVRVPVTLKPKAGGDLSSHIDLYLKTLPENEKPFALIARNAVTLPGERRYFAGAAAYASLIANDEGVSGFLGDAENPAHTAWNSKAKKLATGWRSPADTLSAIRHSLRHFYGLIAEQPESEDKDALIDFFAILDEDQKRKGKKPKVTKVKVDVPPRETAITIRPRKGGFEIAAGPGAANWTYPRAIRVRVAYDMIGANPFSRHSPFDFDLSANAIDIKANDAICEPVKANILKVTAQSKNFRLECMGFDVRRDIVVEARAT